MLRQRDTDTTKLLSDNKHYVKFDVKQNKQQGHVMAKRK